MGAAHDVQVTYVVFTDVVFTNKLQLAPEGRSKLYWMTNLRDDPWLR
jgi:hypothetical protein